MKKGIIAVVFILFLLWAIGSCMEEDKKPATQQTAPQPTKVEQKVEPAANAKDIPLSDKNLFVSYHHDLMAKVDEADSIYEPFRRALQQGDTVDATSIALKIKSPMLSLWGEIQALKTPDLQNKEAKKKLDQAKDAIAGSYLYKANSVKGWIKFAETQDMKKFAELKNKAEDMKTLLYGGIVYLAEAGNMVGADLANTKNKGSLYAVCSDDACILSVVCILCSGICRQHEDS
jgi:hypothetical protein